MINAEDFIALLKTATPDQIDEIRRLLRIGERYTKAEPFAASRPPTPKGDRV